MLLRLSDPSRRHTQRTRQRPWKATPSAPRSPCTRHRNARTSHRLETPCPTPDSEVCEDRRRLLCAASIIQRSARRPSASRAAHSIRPSSVSECPRHRHAIAVSGHLRCHDGDQERNQSTTKRRWATLPCVGQRILFLHHPSPPQKPMPVRWGVILRMHRICV